MQNVFQESDTHSLTSCPNVAVVQNAEFLVHSHINSFVVAAVTGSLGQRMTLAIQWNMYMIRLMSNQLPSSNRFSNRSENSLESTIYVGGGATRGPTCIGGMTGQAEADEGNRTDNGQHVWVCAANDNSCAHSHRLPGTLPRLHPLEPMLCHIIAVSVSR
jgi:hypothetical protein